MTETDLEMYQVFAEGNRRLAELSGWQLNPVTNKQIKILQDQISVVDGLAHHDLMWACGLGVFLFCVLLAYIGYQEYRVGKLKIRFEKLEDITLGKTDVAS